MSYEIVRTEAGARVTAPVFLRDARGEGDGRAANVGAVDDPESRCAEVAGSLLRTAKKLASYSASLALSSLVTVVTIPVVIAVAGADLWSRLAVAQSIGVVVSLVAAAGWGLTGPADVVRLDDRERGRYFLESVWARGYLFLAALVPAALLLLVLQPGVFGLGVVTLIGSGLSSLGASWYFIGESSPARLLWIDNAPRVATALLGVALLAVTRQIWWYIGVTTGGIVLAVAIPLFTIPKRTGVGFGVVSAAPSRSFALLRRQRSALVAASSTAAQINLPIVLISALAPGALIEYALAEKVYKFAQNALSPVVQVVQGWRVDFGSAAHRRSLVHIIAAVSGLGVLLGTGLAVLLPLVSGYLSAGQVHVSWAVSIAFGCGLAVITLSRVVSYAFLMALGARRQVAKGAFVSTAVGLPAVAILGATAGATGAAWALTASEAAALAYQLLVLRALLRTMPTTYHPSVVVAIQD